MSADSHYIVQSVVNALGVLSAFHSSSETLRLREIAARTGFNRCMCFRLLYTLQHCGYLEKLEDNRYRLLAERPGARRFRIGLSSSSGSSVFPREVLATLFMAARSESVEILTTDNRSTTKVAVRNAEQLLAQGVDLVMQFEPDQPIAAAATARYQTGGVPVVAIDAPYPGATYFGVNHYEAGLSGGRHLARWVAAHWGGSVDELLLLEPPGSCPVGRSRGRGIAAGVAEGLRVPEPFGAITIDGGGQFRTSLETVRRWLRGDGAKRILVAASNDASALGALRAFEEAGRASDCAIIGRNAEPEARMELREPRTRFIGSVACSAEQYGQGLIRLAIDILQRRPVPQDWFVKHRLVTRDNVDRYYPNDQFADASPGFAPAPWPVAAGRSR
jgi:ribose transport system substrate-binding protein